jgi:predicted DNA-binding transcriptional regulator AlpA
MLEIFGRKFITDKEASNRYGYSRSWLQYRRSKKLFPKFVKLNGKGRVLYPLDETDTWFKESIQPSEI